MKRFWQQDRWLRGMFRRMLLWRGIRQASAGCGGKAKTEEVNHSRAERDRQLEELSEAVKLKRIDADGSEQLAAARTEDNASCWMTSARGGWSARKKSGRACDEHAFFIF